MTWENFSLMKSRPENWILESTFLFLNSTKLILGLTFLPHIVFTWTIHIWCRRPASSEPTLSSSPHLKHRSPWKDHIKNTIWDRGNTDPWTACTLLTLLNLYTLITSLYTAHNYHVKFVKGIVQKWSYGQDRLNPFGQSVFPRWTEFNQTCRRISLVMESLFQFLIPLFLCCCWWCWCKKANLQKCILKLSEGNRITHCASQCVFMQKHQRTLFSKKSKQERIRQNNSNHSLTAEMYPHLTHH